MTIDPGTIIKGTAGTGTLASALIIERGGKIMAEGTADAAIIMTTVDDSSLFYNPLILSRDRFCLSTIRIYGSYDAYSSDPDKET